MPECDAKFFFLEASNRDSSTSNCEAIRSLTSCISRVDSGSTSMKIGFSTISTVTTGIAI